MRTARRVFRAEPRAARGVWLAVPLVLVAVYALVGFVVAPIAIERYAARYAAARLGHPLALAEVRVNPFSFVVDARGVVLVRPDGQLLVALRRVRLDLDLASLVRRAWVFSELRLEGADVRLEVAPDGRLNTALLSARLAESRTPGEARRALPRLLLQHAVLAEGRFSFVDRSTRPAARIDLAPVDIELFDLSTLADPDGRYTLSGSLPRGGAFAWQGTLSLQPLASAGAVAVTGLALDVAAPLVRERVRDVTALRGTVDVATRYEFAYGAGDWSLELRTAGVAARSLVVAARSATFDAGEAHAGGRVSVRSANGRTDVIADGIEAALAGLVVARPGASAPLAVRSATVRGGRLDAGARTIAADSIALTGGTATLTRSADGRLEWPGVLVRGADAAPAAAPGGGTPWRRAIGMIEVRDFRLAFVDRTRAAPIAYDFDIATARLGNVRPGDPQPITLAVSAQAAQGGTLDARGTVAQDLTAADVTLEARALDLRPLRPALADYATAHLERGTASASVRVAFRREREPALHVQGSAGLDDVLVLERPAGDRLLAFRSLAANGLALGSQGVDIKEVRVLEPGAKLVIDERRRPNLAAVVRATETAPPGDRAPRERYAFRVGRVALQRGTVDFEDRSLVLPFATRVMRVRGAIVGLTSDPASRAELKLDGVIAGSGAATAEGAVRLAAPTAFTDIRARFQNVALPPLSPYSVTFAGRRIDSGRLWLDLHYRMAGNVFEAENRIVLEDFRLGERVASPTALDLPLDLAIAVLTDASGRIDVAIPVTGNPRSPTFDYGRLVREALAQFVGRVATAPFRALGRLAGAEASFASIDFAPGSAGLTPIERAQLDRLAAALAERPRLQIVVHGPYDPKRDRAALAGVRVRRALAAELGLELGAREDPGPVAYDDAATQIALERLLESRAGPDALQGVARERAAQTGAPPQRVNRLLGAFGRASEDRAFYEAAFARLVALEAVPDDALQALAARRARSVENYLIRSAGLDPDRVEIGAPRVIEGDGTPAVTAALELAPRERGERAGAGYSGGGPDSAFSTVRLSRW